MKINFQSTNFNVDRKLTDFSEKKINKLTQYYDRILYAEVVFKVENANDKINKFAELKLSIPGEDIIVKKTCKTFEEAIDLSVRAAERILKRHKAVLR